MRGAFGVGGRGHLTSEVPEEDFQLLGLTGAPPVEVSSRLCLGTVIRLQDLKEAGHVRPNLLHQAVSDCADSIPIALQEAAHESVVVSVGEVIGQLDDFRDGLGVLLGDAAHVQLGVALLLHLGNHPLENGAPPDGKEDLGGDPIGDALQALFDKCFSLSVEFSSAVQEGFTDVIHPICVTGGVFQACESPTANLQRTVEAADHFS